MRVWINDYTTYSRQQKDCVLVTLTEENQRKTNVKCNGRLRKATHKWWKMTEETMDHIFLFSFMGFVCVLDRPILKRKKSIFLLIRIELWDLFSHSEHLIELFCQTIWMSRSKIKTPNLHASKKKRRQQLHVWQCDMYAHANNVHTYWRRKKLSTHVYK